MEKIESIGIQAIISAALAAFASYLGALAVPIIVLMVMMIIDYLSGMSAAWSDAVKQGRRKGHCEKSRVYGFDRGCDGG